MKLKMLNYVIFLMIAFIGTYLFGIQVHAARIYVEVPNDLIYDCPFDVRVMLDTQGQEIMGASLNFDLASGLNLLGLSFGETFKMSYPIQRFENNVKAYAFKFPGVISGIYDFATLRLSQRNVGSPLSQLNFIFVGSGDTTDFMDVYYFGGADVLTQIDNQSFSFVEGSCVYKLPDLTGDMLSTTFDPKVHMSAIQNMIDEFKTTDDTSVLNQIGMYWYVIVALLVLILLLIILLVWYKKKHKQPIVV